MNNLLSTIYNLKDSTTLNDEIYYTMIYERIHYLLEHEINQLFQLLYRIDISEVSVKNVFQEHNETTQISKQLTLLVIARLKQKIDLRNKYSSTR